MGDRNATGSLPNPTAPVAVFRLPNTCTVWLAPPIPHPLPTELSLLYLRVSSGGSAGGGTWRNKPWLPVAAGPRWVVSVEQEAGLLLHKALRRPLAAGGSQGGCACLSAIFISVCARAVVMNSWHTCQD